MELTFAPRNILQINDAKICFRNFKGEGSMYNNEGNRNFSIIIPDEETANALMNDKNEYGAGWNVKIRPAQEEGGQAFMHLPVKVKYTERSKPRVYLITGNRRNELDEDSIAMLDDIDIASVDLDIRPYDGEGRFGPHRTAYLQSIYVVQEIDRFAARWENEE